MATPAAGSRMAQAGRAEPGCAWGQAEPGTGIGIERGRRRDGPGPERLGGGQKGLGAKMAAGEGSEGSRGAKVEAGPGSVTSAHKRQVRKPLAVCPLHATRQPGDQRARMERER